MSDFKVVNRLEELRGLATLSSSDKQEIAEYYFSTLGKTFTNNSCNDCYRDACIEMILHIKRYGMKETTAYKLKNGVLLEPIFAGPMYTNANLTDDAAETFLKHNPEGSNLFAEMPEDWEKRVAKRFTPKKGKKAAAKEAVQEFNEELLSAMIETILSGASEESILETYKEFEIEGTAISSEALIAHYEEALKQAE